jgi:hypothetical protein
MTKYKQIYEFQQVRLSDFVVERLCALNFLSSQ